MEARDRVQAVMTVGDLKRFIEENWPGEAYDSAPVLVGTGEKVPDPVQRAEAGMEYGDYPLILKAVIAKETPGSGARADSPQPGEERHLACLVTFEAHEESNWFIGEGYSDEEARTHALAVAQTFWMGQDKWADGEDLRIVETQTLDF